MQKMMKKAAGATAGGKMPRGMFGMR